MKCLVSVLCLSLTVSASQPARGDLIVNGSFETPSAASFGKIIEIGPGPEPAGFNWTVNSGTVEITEQGYVDPDRQTFAMPAFDGVQWLDLDGISAGSISQSFATTPGTTYALSFAYANNPFVNLPSDSGDPSATVSITDTLSESILNTATISHDTSTPTNANWTLFGPLSFTAIGSKTTLTFQSNDERTSDEGISLDAVNVGLAPAPEPSSLLLFVGGVGCLLLCRRFARTTDRAPSSVRTNSLASS